MLSLVKVLNSNEDYFAQPSRINKSINKSKQKKKLFILAYFYRHFRVKNHLWWISPRDDLKPEFWVTSVTERGEKLKHLFSLVKVHCHLCRNRFFCIEIRLFKLWTYPRKSQQYFLVLLVPNALYRIFEIYLL